MLTTTPISEIMVELRFPASGLTTLNYTQAFPPPPGVSREAHRSWHPSEDNQADTVSAGWYYYLADIAVRRILQRVFDLFYRSSHHVWLQEDFSRLIWSAEELDQQLTQWCDNLPEPVAFRHDSMFTLPNQFLLKLDANVDYFKTYHCPLGMVRVTVEKAWGFAEEAKSSAKRLFSKLTRAAPDCYAKVDVGGEAPWKTATKNNTNSLTWNETHDFVVSDMDQCIKVDVEDEDINGDDEVGLAVTTVREILVAGGRQELPLVHKGEETEGRVSISCQFFKYVADAGSLTASDHKGDGRVSGIATILVASVYGIKGQREDLKPSVVVTWGKTQRFQTVVRADAPGTDISNPAFDQAFRVPITTDSVGSSPDDFRIALLDGEKEIGGVDIPFASVANTPGKILQQKFDAGNGATVRASIRLRGIVPEEMPKAALADRSKQ
ncbi:C2 domain-containing protein [Cladophialophora immunda]|nr:C2 domain-containing protein [Cladophialophora immunda]